MFGIGMPEMLLILAIALIVIGPKKLPDLAKSLGKALREFKQATSELKESIDLDNDLKQVRESFDDIRDDRQHSEGSTGRNTDPKSQSTQTPPSTAESEKRRAENSAGPESPEPPSNEPAEKSDREGSPNHG